MESNACKRVAHLIFTASENRQLQAALTRKSAAEPLPEPLCTHPLLRFGLTLHLEEWIGNE
jgi:hypothetical protein